MNRIDTIIRMFGLLLILVITVSGCVPTATTHRVRYEGVLNFDARLRTQPSAPAWDEQRGQIATKLGDRSYDKEFDLVFNALVIALPNMGVTVGNMERQSGFISASGDILSNNRAKELVREDLVEYCRYLNIDPVVVLDDLIMVGVHDGGRMNFGNVVDTKTRERTTAKLTLQMQKQGAKRTLVKLRFTEVYYPRTLEELYNAVWPALDKQILLDITSPENK